MLPPSHSARRRARVAMRSAARQMTPSLPHVFIRRAEAPSEDEHRSCPRRGRRHRRPRFGYAGVREGKARRQARGGALEPPPAVRHEGGRASVRATGSFAGRLRAIDGEAVQLGARVRQVPGQGRAGRRGGLRRRSAGADGQHRSLGTHPHRVDRRLLSAADAGPIHDRRRWRRRQLSLRDRTRRVRPAAAGRAALVLLSAGVHRGRCGARRGPLGPSERRGQSPSRRTDGLARCGRPVDLQRLAEHRAVLAARDV